MVFKNRAIIIEAKRACNNEPSRRRDIIVTFERKIILR